MGTPRSARDRRRLAEIGLAAAIILASAAVLWSSMSLPPAMLEPIGPAAFPRVVASVLGIFAIVVLGGALRGRPAAQSDTPAATARRPALALVTLALSIVYIGAMQIGILGFREATVVYLAVLGAVLVGFDRRRLIPIGVIAIVIGIGAHWIFTRLFFIDLP
jgi:putative tricarboxylic transport membrane protein